MLILCAHRKIQNRKRGREVCIRNREGEGEEAMEGGRGDEGGSGEREGGGGGDGRIGENEK